MATYRAISTGNASDLARWEVWNGSAWVAATVLPTVADDVYANSYTVTIDVDFFASSYRCTSLGIGVNQNGQFNLAGGVTMTGDVFGDRGANNISTVEFFDTETSPSFIIGNITGGNGVGRRGVNNRNTTQVLTIIGDVYGGTTANSVIGSGGDGIFTAVLSQTHIYGDAYVGNSAAACVAHNVPLGTIVIYGKCVSNNANYSCQRVIANVIEGSAINCEAVNGFIIPSTGVAFFNSCFSQGGGITFQLPDNQNNTITLTDVNSQDQAAPADVRLGTTFANGALTGTLAVPNPATVSLGVPTDNTTGTLTFSIDTNAIAAAITTSLETSLPPALSQPLAQDLFSEITVSTDPLADRLRNVATAQITAAQIAAIP